MNTGNAYYRSVQNIMSSRLLSHNIKIEIYRTIICLLFLWVWNLVIHTEDETLAEGVREQGAKEDIWA
jgi:hypothetical protein